MPKFWQPFERGDDDVLYEEESVGKGVALDLKSALGDVMEKPKDEF